MISAGRVLIMPRGEYDASTTYEMLDLVSYNGSSYVAKRSTTGNLPTNTTYWQLSAYGGSAANMAANFAPIETTEYATRAYSQGDYLVNKDGQFCKVIIAIAIGDEINSTNTETTSVEEVIEDFTTYVDGLDAENAKITGKTAITTQTDLHTLGVGNYFKANTSVYVTNGPTGIDSVPTATFRLTVENINNASGDTTKILTLRTFDGKTYTQAYDGTTWSDWKLLGDNADVPTYTGATSVSDGIKGLLPGASVADRNSAFKGDGTWTPIGTAAAKDSTNAVTSGSTDLVESGAVYEHTHVLEENDDAMLNVLGAKNLLPNTATTQVISDVTFTVNPDDGRITVSGTAQADITFFIVKTVDGIYVPKTGNYILSKAGSDSYYNSDSDYNYVLSLSGTIATNEDVEVTLNKSTALNIALYIKSGTVMNHTIYPMIRPASVEDDTYVPYAMTNRQLSNAFGVNTGVSGLHAYKVGRVVMLSSTLPAVSGTSAGWKSIATLPRELTPLGGGLYFNFFENSANTQASSTVVQASINTSNTLSIYLFSDKLTVTPWGMVTYISKY